MSPNDSGAILVLTTTADEASALQLSRSLVEEGLAACVTRTAVRSVYRWDQSGSGDQPASGSGQDTAAEQESAASSNAAKDWPVCDEAEVLLVIKSAKVCRERLEARLLELHSYDCPEFVVVEPAHVEARYLAWLLAACG